MGASLNSPSGSTNTINTSPPTTAIPQAPGTPTQQVVAGTDIQLPTGQGVESLIAAPAPFRTQAPQWYTPPGTVWAQMGCAVPVPSVQIVTNNRCIWDLVNFCGRGLFDVLWNYSTERLSTSWPATGASLWEMHQLLVAARSRLGAISNPVGGTPLIPAKVGKAPKMFLAYPVPFYGDLGCVNQYFGLFAELTMRAMTDAMSHADNGVDFYVSKGFFQAIYPYLQYLMVQMATKFFGADPTAASAATYVIPATAWAAYDPTTQAVSFEATSPEPPLNYVGPTAADLQNIIALPYEQVVPFLQPWPDSQYYTTSGGVWANSASPQSWTICSRSTPSMEAGIGRGLQHIWCRSTVWSYVTKNTQVQTQAGSANVVFDRIDADGDNGFVGVLRAVPWLKWHITDGGLNLDTSTGSGYSYQTLFESNTITCLPDPEPSWVSYYEGSEPVVEWVGRSPEQRYGAYFWAKPIDDPAGYELHNVHNGIPALKVPGAVYHLTVA